MQRGRSMQGKRILVVEDEADIGELLLLHLADLNVEAQACSNGLMALKELQQGHWDLVILDLRLPGMDGLELCRTLREHGNTVPILMLTAKSSELDRVLGLEVGADDYVTKPFSVIEVMARVRALLRRVSLQQKDAAPVQLQCGRLRLDESRRAAEIAGTALDLTPKEFDLLLFFARAPGKVFRRLQLLDQVWGLGHEGYEHTVNSHINRLRAKLAECAPEEDYILTVWGVGYKFNDQLLIDHVA